MELGSTLEVVEEEVGTLSSGNKKPLWILPLLFNAALHCNQQPMHHFDINHNFYSMQVNQMLSFIFCMSGMAKCTTIGENLPDFSLLLTTNKFPGLSDKEHAHSCHSKVYRTDNQL